jgi:hypothetical protein
MKSLIKIVMNDDLAMEAVMELQVAGYERIYVLANDLDRTTSIAKAADVNIIGFINESAILDKEASFSGNELRSNIRFMGFTEIEAELYEEELDRGHVLLFTVPM